MEGRRNSTNQKERRRTGNERLQRNNNYAVGIQNIHGGISREVKRGGGKEGDTSKAGFRKGMGTIDQIYALNYLINRQIEKEKGKMTVTFIDLKAAFDSVNKDELIKTMRVKGVRKGLINRVEEVLRESKSRIRIGTQCGEVFWMARGIRQGCPLSPILFNLLIADLEEYMRKGGWGGVRLGGGEIFTLMYADDVVLMAEEEQDMRAIIGRLEDYLDGKGLVLNTEKTKIMRCRKGGGRKKKFD